ncbi:hypothetical protein RJT34_32019 [Clitoria ternatea]|uniref:Uncharacterized protein n=1 Tax=Clitoria ternatea TaxID=43366 RepID=A0AAN9EXG3_CLITE
MPVIHVVMTINHTPYLQLYPLTWSPPCGTGHFSPSFHLHICITKSTKGEISGICEHFSHVRLLGFPSSAGHLLHHFRYLLFLL